MGVWKPDKKSVRICGEFKKTVNRASKLDKYPNPKLKTFCDAEKRQVVLEIGYASGISTKLMKLYDTSKQFVVANMLRGLFRYTRLPFGIASAPGIF